VSTKRRASLDTWPGDSGCYRNLAQTEIAGTTAARGDPLKLAAAAREMSTAAQELAMGHYQQAIGHYKNAWQAAETSLPKR
jgi:hypothetical protein